MQPLTRIPPSHIHLTSTDPEPPSAIPELQEAFSILLRIGKPKPKKYHFPTWPGPFRLLDLPRELRDRIYLFTFAAPEPIIYRRKTPDHIHSPKYAKKPSLSLSHFHSRHHHILSLLLTSHQIHAEALQALCRHSTIQITYKSQLDAALRLFPTPHAAFLQKLTVVYDYDVWKYKWKRQRPCGGWLQMQLDAQLAKAEWFPRLRDFTAQWRIHPMKFEYWDEMVFGEQSVGEMREIWLEWMRSHFEVDRVVPPEWLRVRLDWVRRVNGRQEWGVNAQCALDEALEKFREEVRGREGVNGINVVGVEELEAEGRKWMDEGWDDSKKRRPKRKVRQTGTEMK